MTDSANQMPPDSPARPPMAQPWRVVLFVLLGWGILAGLPYVRGIPTDVGTLAATVLFLLLTLLVIREAARFPLSPLVDVLGLAAFLGLWHYTRLWMPAAPHLRPVLGAAMSMFFLLACVCFGRLLAQIVRERNMLLPVAIIAGLADIFTVFFGPTGKVLAKAPAVVKQLSVAIPTVGSATGAHGAAGVTALATAGLGDFVFLTLFLVGVYRFGLRAGHTFWIVFAFTLAGMLSVLFFKRLPAAPLLPFIVVGFLIANARAFSLSRQERVYMAIAIVFIVALLAGAAILMRGL